MFEKHPGKMVDGRDFIAIEVKTDKERGIVYLTQKAYWMAAQHKYLRNMSNGYAALRQKYGKDLEYPSVLSTEEDVEAEVSNTMMMCLKRSTYMSRRTWNDKSAIQNWQTS